MSQETGETLRSEATFWRQLNNRQHQQGNGDFCYSQRRNSGPSYLTLGKNRIHPEVTRVTPYFTVHSPMRTDASEMSHHSDLKKYQFFPGRNWICCKGRLFLGSTNLCSLVSFLAYITLMLTMTLLVITVIEEESYYIASNAVVIALYLLTTFGLIGTVMTDPGIIPRGIPHDVNYDGQDIDSYCTTCHIFRPQRAHHCRECDNCIDRFDHHCFMIGCCIGKRNYKPFLLFINCKILSGIVGAIIAIIAIFMDSKMGFFVSESNFRIVISFVVAILSILEVIMSCPIVILHCSFVLYDITNYEKFYKLPAATAPLAMNPEDGAHLRRNEQSRTSIVNNVKSVLLSGTGPSRLALRETATRYDQLVALTAASHNVQHCDTCQVFIQAQRAKSQPQIQIHTVVNPVHCLPESQQQS